MMLVTVLPLAFVGFTVATAAGPVPPSCSTTVTKQFTFKTVPYGSAPPKTPPTVCASTDPLNLTIKNSVLDTQGYTGYIASNEQLQFDKPVQPGALYSSGFSACPDGLLALGPTEAFWNCTVGPVTSIYYSQVSKKCTEIELRIVTIDETC